MPTLKLTDRGLKSLQTDKRQEDFLDRETPGFGVRVTADRRRTFFVRYRVNGRRPRMWLGMYPAVSLAEARLRALECLVNVARGGDPQGERQSERTAPTFADLAAEYLSVHAKRKKRSWREDERMLELDLLPPWRHRTASEITVRDVNAVLDRIVERGAPVTANRTRALISKVFNFGIGRGVVSANPVTGVPVPATEKPRDRVLVDEEILRVWEASLRLPAAMGATFRLRLLTAQRGGEVLSMRWRDLQGDWWVIPAERAKNGLEHRVPLGSLALELVDEMRELEMSREWIFPSPTKPTQHLTVVGKAARKLAQLAGVDFVPHDLRRTAASRMASMGVPRHVLAKILNHADSGVTAIYDRYSYDREKREALSLWNGHLQKLLRA